MNLFNRHNKKIYFYALYKKDEPQKFLTVTIDKDECIEYALALLKKSRMQHFSLWCKDNNYDINSTKAWDEYYVTRISDEEKQQYLVCKIMYKLNDLVAIIRMFGGSVPMNCSFNLPIEYEYAAAKADIGALSDEVKKQLKEIMKSPTSKEDMSDGK